MNFVLHLLEREKKQTNIQAPTDINQKQATNLYIDTERMAEGERN